MGVYYLRPMVRNQGDDPISRLKHRMVALVTIVLVISVFLARPPATNAKFVIAVNDWSYPDQYGQGLQFITIYNSTNHAIDTIGYNVTGSWVSIQDVFELNANESYTLSVFTWLNKTQVGIASLAEGQNFQRHTISVSYTVGQIVFSQEGFDYMLGTDSSDPMYFYRYNVTLQCFNVYAVIYTVVIGYEIFY